MIQYIFGVVNRSYKMVYSKLKYLIQNAKADKKPNLRADKTIDTDKKYNAIANKKPNIIANK